MIDWWIVFVDLETYIDLCLYIFPFFFFFCAKNSSPNVNLQMKKDIKLQKPVSHTSIWLGKRESNQKLKCMIVQKVKGYPIKGKYQKTFLWWDVIMSKRSNDGVKCKAPSYVITSYERSYMHTSIIEMDHMI